MPDNANKKPAEISSGIDDLVQRLKDEGIDAGEHQANEMLRQAELKAEKIISDAEQQAKRILLETEAQIDIDKRAADEAVKIAFRDLVLDMKSRLLARLSDAFSQQVKETLESPQLIEKIVYEAAEKILSENKLPSSDKVEILIPESLLQLQDIKQNPEQAANDSLAKVATELHQKMMHQGVELKGHNSAGIRIRLTEDDIEVDITDKAVADLLLEYLQPRFLARFDGVIR